MAWANGGAMKGRGLQGQKEGVVGRRLRALLCGVGLACWIVTLTLHSATVTPFQRFAGLGGFVGTFAPQALAISAVVAAVVALAALRGHRLPGRVLYGLGASLYVLTTLAFALLSLGSIASVPAAGILLFSVVTSLGSVALGLVWGRTFKLLGARLALVSVGIAGVASAVLGAALAHLPGALCAGLFVACAVATALLPLACGFRAAAANVDAWEDGAAGQRSMGERLRSFADVCAPALIGLLAFAFVVGTMRALVVEAHPFHLISLAIDGAVLVVLGLVRSKNLLAGLVYRNLIPALAVLLLAVGNISLALVGSSPVDTAMIYLLYTLAALLTLATLAAVAHAGEFPSDFVYGIPFALFCLASFAGLQCAEVMSDEAVWVSTTVITTVYAFAMVVVPALRAQRIENTEAELLLDRDERGRAEASSGKARGGAAANDTREARETPTLEERCAELVRIHRLTGREAEILAYLAAGYGSGYISEALYISPNTVRTHIHNIYGKLGVNSREEVLDLVKSGR